MVAVGVRKIDDEVVVSPAHDISGKEVGMDDAGFVYLVQAFKDPPPAVNSEIAVDLRSQSRTDERGRLR
jgi:hypothetical protein